ncbi:MAG: thiol reductant ABC exporter subunit CydD [Burkholderiales bacterium]|nr:thiol reductant ABC exporter subunit CydD [Burkholderiales bacterium]
MKSSVTGWLREQARPVRRLLAAGIVAGALQAVLMCVGAWLIAHVLAAAIFHGQALAQVWPALAALPLLAALRFALTLWQRRMTFEAGARVSAVVRQTLEARMRQLGPRWSAQQSSGDLATRVVDGLDALVPYYAGYLPQMAFAVVVPAIILLAVLPADPWSALVLAITAPLVPVFMVLVGQAAEHASEQRWMRLRRMGARFMDALSGLTTLRLYRAAAREQATLARTGEAYRRETMAVLRIAFLSALVLEFFATVSIAVLAVLIGFRLMWGHLAFEPGLFILLLAPEFFLPLRQLGVRRHQRMEAAAAAEDLVGLLATNGPPGDTFAAPSTAPAPVAFQASRVALACEGLSFGYAPDRQVLRGLDLTVAAGTTITVVGASGGGKSTLLALLMGFVEPAAGRIFVNGQNLSGLEMSAWRRHIAWVPQRPHVFHGTLRENLLIAAPHADQLQLQRAIHAAALAPVVARLPQGLETPLGERGFGLSGGECQRLALARAWLRDAPLLLLDEPTQHLDSALSADVDAALASLCEGRTVVRVAHRLAALADHEQVAVLAHGQIAEQGTVAALRAANGIFADLLQADLAA